MTWAMFLLAILASTLGRIFGEDTKSLIPRISRALLRQAARRMNPAFGPGFYEEWVAHLEDTPELTLKLWHACSVYLWGAGRICREIGYSHETLRRYDRVKRIFDLSAAILLVPTVFLFVTTVGLAVRLSGHPPFYWETIQGRDNRQIRILRIVTIRKLDQAERGIFDQADPRWRFRSGSTHCVVTPIGRVLRRTGMDELTMIWNVLRGDLSLVGPRLSKSSQVKRDNDIDAATVKPGISGWSQVNRGIKNESENAKLDEEYCERRSLVFDLKIIWLTMVSVFLRR